MAERRSTDRMTLTLSLSPSLALRLTQAAEARKLSAADVVLDLLDRHLPQADTGEKKAKIPYS